VAGGHAEPEDRRPDVLAGDLRLILGERELLLRPGEVAEFDTNEPHWFGPAGAQPVEILHLFGPHGDKAYVREQPGHDDR
jgi:quercetin dioxygenase-like cupin family protein